MTGDPSDVDAEAQSEAVRPWLPITTLILGMGYRTLAFGKLRRAVGETIILFGSILMIIGVTHAMGFVLTYDRVPQTIAPKPRTSSSPSCPARSLGGAPRISQGLEDS